MSRVPHDQPDLTTDSEKAVWEALCDQADPDDLLLANVRVTHRGEDREVDFLVGFAGLGVVAIEVKGRSIRYDQPMGTKSRGLALLSCAGLIGSPGSPAGWSWCAGGVVTWAGGPAPVSCPT
jgi:hypothetical protein